MTANDMTVKEICLHIISLSPSLPGPGSGDAKASGAQALGTDLMGREGSPASHQSFGGLMYMHHSSQLYPWAEFSYRCTSKVSCLMLSMEGRITRFRFSWIRESTGSALKHREVEIKISLLGFPGSPVVKNPPCNTRDTGSIPGPGRPHMRRGNQPGAPQLLSQCSRARELQLLETSFSRPCSINSGPKLVSWAP